MDGSAAAASRRFLPPSMSVVVSALFRKLQESSPFPMLLAGLSTDTSSVRRFHARGRFAREAHPAGYRS
jgi:hypothetical protein